MSDIKFFRASGESAFAPISPTTMNGHANGSVANTDADTDMDASSDPAASEALAPAPSSTNTSTAEAKPNVLGANADATLPPSFLYLVTAGFDSNVRIWSADEWNLVRNLPTDAGKVMSADISGDGRFIASASYSRSFHLFGGDNSL